MDRSAKLSKGAGVMLGAVALATLPAASEGATVNETGANDTFPGTQQLAAGDTVQGAVQGTDIGSDEIDFYSWINLPAGGTYHVTLENIEQQIPGEDINLTAQQYLPPPPGTPDAVHFIDVQTNDTDSFSGPIPGSGVVVIGVRVTGLDSAAFETYNLTLTADPPAGTGVPQPAALALVTAGLIGVGLHKARRRRD